MTVSRYRLFMSGLQIPFLNGADYKSAPALEMGRKGEGAKET